MDERHKGKVEPALPPWERPELVSLKLSETRTGVFCTTQENFDNAIVDFFFGSDPNCVIGG